MIRIEDSIVEVVKLLPTQAEQDRLLGIVFRYYVMGEQPDLTTEQPSVVVAATAFMEAQAALAMRAARNARYYAKRRDLERGVASDAPDGGNGERLIRRSEEYYATDGEDKLQKMQNILKECAVINSTASYKTEAASYKTATEDNLQKAQDFLQKCEVINSEASYKTPQKRERKKKETREKEISPHTPYIERESKEIKKERETTPPLPPSRVSVDDLFDAFWRVYPRKTAKADARKAFGALMNRTADRNMQPLVCAMVAAVGRFAKTYDWQKGNGTFVPYPATWIRGERWKDELPALPADEAAREAGDTLAERLAERMKL